MPSSGYATEPSVSLLDNDRACVVWRQEKDWGYQLMEMLLDNNGEWHEPAIVILVIFIDIRLLANAFPNTMAAAKST